MYLLAYLCRSKIFHVVIIFIIIITVTARCVCIIDFSSLEKERRYYFLLFSAYSVFFKNCFWYFEDT